MTAEKLRHTEMSQFIPKVGPNNLTKAISVGRQDHSFTGKTEFHSYTGIRLLTTDGKKHKTGIFKNWQGTIHQESHKSKLIGIYIEARLATSNLQSKFIVLFC